MNFNLVKEQFNNEWINKLCDDLQSKSEFVQRNKMDILESLLVAINNSIDLTIPVFKNQRETYLFVSNEIEKELENRCYVA